MPDVSIRTLLLEFVDSNRASHIREMHVEILPHKPDITLLGRARPPTNPADLFISCPFFESCYQGTHL
jgi:hypothetical protein